MAVKERIKSLMKALQQGIVERDVFLQIIFLSILTNQPIYIFGRPGSGKSLLVKRAKQAFAAKRTLRFGKRFRTLPDKLEAFDLVYFMSFDGSDEETRNAANIVFQEFEDRPIILSGSRRPESNLSEAGVIDSINISLSLPETLKPESLKQLLSASFDEEGYDIPEELKVTPEEKKLWLSEINKVTISSTVLDLIGRFSAACDDARIYVSVRRWKKFLRMLKMIAFCNDRSQVELTDTFLLGMPIWSRARNNAELNARFLTVVEEIMLQGIPDVGNIEESSVQLRQTAEHLMNASDDVFDTVEYAGELCLKHTIKISGESFPLYVPERYIGTHESFNPYNELRQKEKHVLCNFEGSTECTVSIDTVVKGVGLRSSANAPVGKTFEKFAKLPSRVLELNNPQKQQENREAFENFRKSIDGSMENFANAMIRLKTIYKDLKSYPDDPFFNAEYYARIQALIKNKFEQASAMIQLLKDVRSFMDAPRY